MAKQKFVKRLVPVTGQLREIPINTGKMVDGVWQDTGVQQQTHALVDNEYRRVIPGQVFSIEYDADGNLVRTLLPNEHVAEVFERLG